MLILEEHQNTKNSTKNLIKLMKKMQVQTTFGNGTFLLCNYKNVFWSKFLIRGRVHVDDSLNDLFLSYWICKVINLFWKTNWSCQTCAV